MTSFEFKWTKDSKSTSAKVFSTKPKVVRKSKSIDTQKNPSAPKFKAKERQFKSKQTPSVLKDVEVSNFVKRKRNKDKVKSQIGRDGLEESSGPKNHSLFSEKHKNVHIDINKRGVSLVEKVFSAGKKFSDLNIHKHIVSNLQKHQYSVMTNVQEKALPIVLRGDNCLIRSQTGSGKTLTYAIPILNSLVIKTPKIQRSDGIEAIIVVPTRELALQTFELFIKLNTFQWIIVGHLCGGENRKTEKDKLRRGVHVLIGTPGRLLDHILHTSAFNAKNVSCLVLDEADRLLDMGFKKDIVRLVEELSSQKRNASYNPLALLRGEKTMNDASSITKDDTERQTILLSATLTKGIAELADFTMKKHVYIDALDEAATTNPEHIIIPNTVKQEFILTFVKHRLVMLSALLIAKAKQNSKTFVFMATTQMVDFHYELFKKYLLKMPIDKGQLKVGDVLLLDEVELEDSGDEVQVLDVELFKLHGSMQQQERKIVFDGFRKANKGILLCTDVVARGIDVPQADCIIQYTGPQSDDDYVHRVGRTGRAGKSGSAIIFLTHEEQDYVSHLQEHKVFLKQYDTTATMNNLLDFMEEPDRDKATVALQKRYETAIANDKELHKMACFAYSSWSRFYSAFPAQMRAYFDLKHVNVGHFVTSFGLRESPSAVAKFVRGQAGKGQAKKLNKKLANHQDNVELQQPGRKRAIKSVSLTTSEFSSGLEPAKKKMKKKDNAEAGL